MGQPHQTTTERMKQLKPKLQKQSRHTSMSKPRGRERVKLCEELALLLRALGYQFVSAALPGPVTLVAVRRVGVAENSIGVIVPSLHCQLTQSLVHCFDTVGCDCAIVVCLDMTTLHGVTDELRYALR